MVGRVGRTVKHKGAMTRSMTKEGDCERREGFKYRTRRGEHLEARPLGHGRARMRHSTYISVGSIETWLRGRRRRGGSAFLTMVVYISIISAIQLR